MLLDITRRPRLLKLNYSIRPFKKVKSVEIPFGFAISHKKSEKDKSILRVKFNVTGGGEDMPFDLTIETETLFNIKKEAKDSDLMKAVFLEAGPVIFPVINEYFTDLGRKANLPIESLPDVDFKEFYEYHKSSTKKDKDK